MTPLHQIKNLAIGQILTGTVGALILTVVEGIPRGLSFAAGAAVMLSSLLSLSWVGWRVFEQKTVAWTIVAIISKYALFLSSIYYLTRTAWFNVAAAGLGIASFVLPALVVAVFTPERESLRGGSSF